MSMTLGERDVHGLLLEDGRPDLAAWWLYRCDPDACWSTFGTMAERGDMVALCPELDPGADRIAVHVVVHDGRLSAWAGCSVCGGQSGTRTFDAAEALARDDEFGLAGWIGHHVANGHGLCRLFSIAGWS